MVARLEANGSNQYYILMTRPIGAWWNCLFDTKPHPPTPFGIGSCHVKSDKQAF